LDFKDPQNTALYIIKLMQEAKEIRDQMDKLKLDKEKAERERDKYKAMYSDEKT